MFEVYSNLVLHSGKINLNTIGYETHRNHLISSFSTKESNDSVNNENWI